jgi:hypothetical protein
LCGFGYRPVIAPVFLIGVGHQSHRAERLWQSFRPKLAGHYEAPLGVKIFSESLEHRARIQSHDGWREDDAASRGNTTGGTVIANLPKDPAIQLRVKGSDRDWSNVELAPDPTTSGWMETRVLVPITNV